MRFKKSVAKIIAMLLCVVSLAAVLCCTPEVSVTVSAKKSASELKAELAEAKENSNKLKSKINDLKNKNAPYAEQKETLQKQIDATQKEIDLYQEQIDRFDEEIGTFQKQIDEIEKRIDENLAIFSQRLVVLYTTGSFSDLEVLLSADDFSEYLQKSQLTKSLYDYDNKILAELTADIAAVDEKKQVIEDDKKEIVDSQSIIAEKQAELDKQYTEVATIVRNNESNIASLQDDYEDMLDEQKEIQKALNEITGNMIGTGQFIWPCPGYYKITSKFGYRVNPVTGVYKLHSGVDIGGGNYGARIIAADDGTVSLSKWNGGYGNCVIINHNNGYSTLYGHMKAASSLRVGQSVKKGDTVGYVGSTGNSTGPHLHFEIRVKGSPKNPLQWFNI